VFEGLATAGIVVGAGRARRVGRQPVESDAYPEFETEAVAAVVEKRFMEWVLHGDCRPGQQINSLELGRQLGVSTSALREYLGHFSHFGLLEKRQNGAWVFKGFTHEFAVELSEVRELFEIRSAERFILRAPDDPAWQKLEQIRRQHITLRRQVDKRYSDFSALDERFHRLINDASGNRFVRQFYDVISMIFHYHYHWNKADERERNAVAIDEHLAYIAALQSRDPETTLIACRAHMKTARATLLLSIDRFDAQAAGDSSALATAG
jgi:DNA-binding GntR family transcriptional regulator